TRSTCSRRAFLPAPSPARRRCARCRSSTSSSRCAAACTAARWVISASTATWTSPSPSAPRSSRTGACTCRRRRASSRIPTRAPNGWKRSTRRAHCCARPSWRTRSSNPELVHAREGLGIFDLEAVPASQVGGVGEARAVARKRLAAIRELEAEETQAEARDHRLDLRQAEAHLVHVEQQVAATAHAVEVLVARDGREQWI